MILVFRKRFIWCAGLLGCFFAVFAAVLWLGQRQSRVPAFAALEEGPMSIVVLDPGHGGEDGGAVSPDGVEESRINLAVALRVNDLLRFAGQPTVMTREEDVSISTSGDTVRARKASDIRRRVEIVNETENAVLLSIHQNSLPSSVVTHGAQVFWNGEEGAEALARVVQDSLNGAINVNNEKQPKRIPDTIYLMRHITAPGILVECGFLSNPEETVHLQDPSYQTKLAAAITAGYLRRLAGEEAE